MTNRSLAESYLEKARARLKILPVLFEAEAHSDVVREAQEIVELALKGILRMLGIEPPHWHDVGGLLIEYRERLPEGVAPDVDDLAEISAWLRKEREFSFYGEIDFIPTERYGDSDAQRAMAGAQMAVASAEQVIAASRDGARSSSGRAGTATGVGMTEGSTVATILGGTDPGAPAIGAPGRPYLSYGELRDHIGEVVAGLNARGIGRNDRVAIVLPNGPEMATAFVAIASGATTAPLNPAYRREEFDFYLADLGARALVVPRESDSPAIDAASALGVEVLEIVADEGAPAGTFRFAGSPSGAAAGDGGMATADDVALVLHTSGTTSRPKIVPLTHANVCASAENIGATLRLTPDDRCLNVMPLFHIHGLMAAILATLRAGAGVSCTPGFNALKFFAWLDEVRPSWYTAVPTMHQAILARADRNRSIIDEISLRFVRSSSASLPVPVLQAIEELFDCPLVEAYAMTEAAHQMTCNPLPPGVRKPGTVGPAAGPEVAIMDADGNLLEPGEVGEVVIRGPNVTSGYESNPEANAAAFTDGWFRTGDQGVMDEDQYLTITGRLKEIINRGGEKVSPLEVDAVLMDHPAVEQVVTFAMPHDKLGEEVAAAVVLRDGQEVDEREMRDFCAQRLADFKVPRKVLFLDEIPKGATGKLQRIGLAEKLGLG